VLKHGLRLPAAVTLPSPQDHALPALPMARKLWLMLLLLILVEVVRARKLPRSADTP